MEKLKNIIGFFVFVVLVCGLIINNQVFVNANGLKMPGRVLGTNTSAYAYESGSLVNHDGTIYFINGTVKIPFTNLEAFLGLGYSLKNVIKGDLSNYTSAKTYFITSPSQAHPWGSYLLHKGTVYYSHETGMIPIPSWDVFMQNGGKDSMIVAANSYDIKAIKTNTEQSLLAKNDSRVYGQQISGAIQLDLLSKQKDSTASTQDKEISVQCNYPNAPIGYRYEGVDSETSCGRYLVLDENMNVPKEPLAIPESGSVFNKISPTPTPTATVIIVPTPTPNPNQICSVPIFCAAPPVGYYYDGGNTCNCGTLKQDLGDRKTAN